MKVSVYVPHYNNIILLVNQYHYMKNFCKENIRYVVINNGANELFRNAFSQICTQLNIEEITIPTNNAIHNTAMNHKTALQHCYKNIISNDDSDIRIVMDSDIIPFKEFSFVNLLGDNDIAGIQMGIGDLYIASFISIYGKNVDLHELDLGVDVEFDSGVPTGYLVRKYKTKWLRHTSPLHEEEGKYIFQNSPSYLVPYQHRYVVQFIEGSMIHYYRGSGWDNGDPNYLRDKHTFVMSFIMNHESYAPILDEHVQYESAHMDQWLNKLNYRLYVKLSNISN